MKTSLSSLPSASVQTSPVTVSLSAGEFAELATVAAALGSTPDQLARRLTMQAVKWAWLLIRNRPNVTGELVAANADHCPAPACADAQDHTVTLSLSADEFTKLAAVAAGYLVTPENVARTFILEASKWTATVNSKRLAGPGALVVVGVSHG